MGLAESGWRCVARKVPYEVDNPRYLELDSLLSSAQALAPTLWASCESGATKGPLAWSGGTADESFAQLTALRGRAQQAASNTVEKIRAARDREPQKLTKYRTEWHWEPVGN